jgi:hypothetical protein
MDVIENYGKKQPAEAFRIDIGDHWGGHKNACDAR